MASYKTFCNPQQPRADDYIHTLARLEIKKSACQRCCCVNAHRNIYSVPSSTSRKSIVFDFLVREKATHNTRRGKEDSTSLYRSQIKRISPRPLNKRGDTRAAYTSRFFFSVARSLLEFLSRYICAALDERGCIMYCARRLSAHATHYFA